MDKLIDKLADKTIIASDKRGKYILNGLWIEFIPDTKEYGACVFGDINHFKRCLQSDTDKILTPIGQNIINTVNQCTKGYKCSYCKSHAVSFNCIVKEQ